MAIREMTSQVCQGFREEINALISPLAKKYGVTIGLGTAKFTPDNIIFKLEIARIKQDDDNGGDVSLGQKTIDFQRYAPRYGMRKEHLFRYFRHNGDLWKIVGAMPRRKKCPILAESTGKKKLLFGASYVLTNMAPEGVKPEMVKYKPRPIRTGLVETHPSAESAPKLPPAQLPEEWGMAIYDPVEYANKKCFSPSGKIPSNFNLVTKEGSLLRACVTEDEAVKFAQKLIDLQKA